MAAILSMQNRWKRMNGNGSSDDALASGKLLLTEFMKDFGTRRDSSVIPAGTQSVLSFLVDG